MEPDLETAIALSASLHEEETRNKEKEQALLANGYDGVINEEVDTDMKYPSEADINKPVAARGKSRKNKFRGGLFALSLTSDKERKLKTSERATEILMEMVEACDRKVHDWHGVDIPSTPLFGLKPSSFHQVGIDTPFKARLFSKEERSLLCLRGSCISLSRTWGRFGQKQLLIAAVKIYMFHFSSISSRRNLCSWDKLMDKLSRSQGESLLFCLR